MSILVTGGAGYIGTHTIVELLNAGYDVIALDNFSNSRFESLKRVKEITGKSFTFYQADLLDKLTIDRLFSEHTIDAVIHFAGLKAVNDSIQKPLTYYHNNITATLHLCQVMEKHKVKRLIFSSSATVYGIPDTLPLLEDSPLRPINPYGRSKLMIEEILRDLYDSDEHWSISILRYFNPTGAHLSGKIGEDPVGIPNNLMPYITKVATGEFTELKVFGESYPTEDGTGVRDYIHVTDLAIGHIKALEKCLNTSGVDIYNLGTGRGYSVLHLIKTFQTATGQQVPYSIVEPRPGDAASCYADATKAELELEWKADRGLNEMCEDAWRWQQHNPSGYKKSNRIFSGVVNPSRVNAEGRDFLIP